MAKDKDPFDDLFEPFELEDGPPPAGSEAPTPPAAEPETRPAAPVEQVPCPSCGAYNPSYNRHCEQCGARLTKEPLPVAPAPMVRATPDGRALSVLAAAVLVVALVALLVNVFRGGDGAETTTTIAATTTTDAVVELTQITPTQVTASDRLSAGFDESNLIDDDLATEWQVNQATNPLTLEFRFAQPVEIRYIEIYNITDQDRFLRNYRIKGYKITTDDLPVEIRSTLLDLAGGPQRIDIASFGAETLTLEILTNYPSQAIGDQPAFEELVLSEVKFWGTSAS